MEEQLFGTGMDSEDPLIKLKSRELDIRQANDERRMAEERAQRAQQARMEAAKLRQQERLNEERIQSSEDMAKLRASIDVTKMFMPKPGGGVPGN
jgi:DNA replication protein DnaC